MTNPQHIQTYRQSYLAGASRERLRDVAVTAVMLAVVLGLALGASWLLPLEFVVPRPR